MDNFVGKVPDWYGDRLAADVARTCPRDCAEHPTIHEPGDVRRKVQHAGHGHACPQCEGIGTVRLRGRPGGDRRPCPTCGGSGQLRPGR